MEQSLNKLRRMMGRAIWLVPGILALQQVGPSGLQTAEGCSGGAPGEGWRSLEVSGASALKRVPVATDGFVLFEGILLARGIDPQNPDLQVLAMGADGTEIQGQVRYLESHLDIESGLMWVQLGWQSDQPLALGTIVQLRWATGDEELGAGGAGIVRELSGGIELEVVGEPTPLPAPQVALGPWVDVRHGVGALAECVGGVGSCGPYAIEVPTQETQLVGAVTSWELPAISGMVAWEIRGEVADPENGGAGPVRRRPVIGRQVTGADVVEAGTVTFAADATDYCAVLIVKDLRTGEEVRSAPRCAEPGEPAFMEADHALRQCEAPPTPESKALWCEGRAATFPQLCAPSEQPPSEQPAQPRTPDSIGNGLASGPSDSPEREPDPVAAANADSSGRPRTSKGCQLAPSRGSLGLAAATLGVLLSLFGRRRRAPGA